MLTIGVDLLAETIRATSADDLAATGERDPGEWPPSPARLFAAFVAADGTGPRCHVTDGGELSVLERAGDPRILADQERDVPRTELQRRFVVVDERARSTVQDYPARSAAEVRPGTRRSPRHPQVWFTWPELDVDGPVLAALQRRAARIGYLGCADSPVRISVGTEPPVSDLPEWAPSDVAPRHGAAVALPVVEPGLLAALDEAFDAFSAGLPSRRSWLPSPRRWYSTEPDGPEQPRAGVIWLRFDEAVPGRQALAVTEALRRATLELYDRWSAPEPGALPPVVTGHGFTGKGFHHAYWLVLPDVDHRHPRGRLHGAAVWLPPETPDDVVSGVRTALGHLHELVTKTGRRISVRPYDGVRQPRAARPDRWKGPARRWGTVLPVVHEQWGRVDRRQVTRWCEHAGLPAPVWWHSSPVPLVPGGLALRPHEVHREGNERRPFSHLIVEFAEEVQGPVVLGRGRQFGMGLCAPLHTPDDGERRSDG